MNRLCKSDAEAKKDGMTWNYEQYKGQEVRI